MEFELIIITVHRIIYTFKKWTKFDVPQLENIWYDLV